MLDTARKELELSIYIPAAGRQVVMLEAGMQELYTARKELEAVQESKCKVKANQTNINFQTLANKKKYG